MDNKAYLDQIAVKAPKRTGGKVLSPFVIKLLIVGISATIILFALGGLVNQLNSRSNNTFHKLFYTFEQLNGNNSPFKKYKKQIRSSKVSAMNASLMNSLENTNKSLKNIKSQVIKNDLPSDIKTTVDTSLAMLGSKFEDGLLVGEFDKSFASATYYEIIRLIALENEALKKTDNNALVDTLNRSIKDLTQIRDLFDNFINR